MSLLNEGAAEADDYMHVLPGTFVTLNCKADDIPSIKELFWITPLGERITVDNPSKR